MSQVNTLQRLLDCPQAFRRALRIDTDSGARPLEGCLDDWQRRDFLALDEPLKAVANRRKCKVNRAWLERPRGHSKTSDLAVIACWLLLSRRRVKGVAGAGDKDQAKLLRDAVETLVLNNRWLGEILEVQAYQVRNRQTGSTLQIIAADAPTSYGALVDFIICDEVCHWPKRDLWDSLVSTGGKRKHCLLLVISNAGHTTSWQWHARELARRRENWHFSRLDGPQASWIGLEQLQEQRDALPAVVYRRLWDNEWTEGRGDALDAALIKAALRLKEPPPRRKGSVYVAGVDIGVSRDATSVTVVGKDVGHFETVEPEPLPLERAGIRAMRELGMWPSRDNEAQEVFAPGSGRLELARVLVWRPRRGKVQLAAVEEAIADLDAELGLAGVVLDPSQAEYLAQRLVDRGIEASPFPQTGPALNQQANDLLHAFAERRIDLYPCDDLLGDLRNLQIEEKSYGYRLVSPTGEEDGGTRHGDTATALQLAITGAKHLGAAAATRARKLVLHPA